MVSSETKKRRRKDGQKRKKASRVEFTLEELEKAEAPQQEVDVHIVQVDEDDPEYKHFKDVFAKLQPQGAKEGDDDADSDSSESSSDDSGDEKKARKQRKTEAGDAAAEKKKKLSKKEQRRASRMTVAQLKQAVENPSTVEPHDINSSDPKLLVHLKSCRNSVPIPRHWCHKRKYLSHKRGFTKPPFELPSFIAATGIARIREAYLEREEQRKDRLKGQVRAKVNRLDIDFAEMQNAFFKHATRPPLSDFGEVYYEGREKEIRNKYAKPGVLSDRLKDALGMPEGYPPPWLINMQRFGPPPSYPSLSIPGLNAPLPPNARWGYTPGGWGKVPVNPETAQPLYGDVFGNRQDKKDKEEHLWGKVENDSDAEMYEEDQALQPDDETTGTTSVLPTLDNMTESGIASVTPSTPTASGTETPNIIDLRKRTDPPASQKPYQILEQTQVAPTGLMGSTFAYNVKDNRTVDVSLSEADVARLQAGDTDIIRDKFEAQNVGAIRERNEVADAFDEERRARAKRDTKRKKDFKF
ncbi:Pre-mRNA-splicing factor sap145 [Diplonema papillatum]|nr:Pre-mRNA-splicing factor sap145 [Diplonema papillatum]WGM49957.1 SF3B2 [Diplonema papillatum]